MINCPKCGAGNDVGVLFCRNCGDRLDLQAVRPEVRRGRTGKDWDAARIAGTVFKLFMVVVLLYVLFLGWGLFARPAGMSGSVSDDTVKETAQKKLDAMFVTAYKVPKTYEFTSEELTALADSQFRLPVAAPTEGAGLVILPEHMEILVRSSNTLQAFLRVKMWGMTVYNTVLFRLEPAEEDGPVKIRVLASQFGTTSVPDFLRDRFLARFHTMVADTPELAFVLKYGKEMTAEDGTLKFTIPAAMTEKGTNREIYQDLLKIAPRHKSSGRKPLELD